MANARPYQRLQLSHQLDQKHLEMRVEYLRASFRRYIRIYLDEPSNEFARNHLSKDWEGLAELMGLDMQTIDDLRRSPVNPKTMGLLEAYGKRPEATVGKLLMFIQELERFDILEDNVPFDLIRRDHEVYLENRKKTQPVQDTQVSTSVDLVPMVVGDTEDQLIFYDAFVSYCLDDLPFVEQMIHMLEKVHGLKLCIQIRDLLPGVSELHATAKLIAHRCKKVILVLSQDFVASEECDFQTRVALALSPGAKLKILIPILYKQCQLPIVLNHVCLVDFTKVDIVDWFWGRLAASLRSQQQYTLPPEDEEQLDSISLMDHPTMLDHQARAMPLPPPPCIHEPQLSNSSSTSGYGSIPLTGSNEHITYPTPLECQTDHQNPRISIGRRKPKVEPYEQTPFHNVPTGLRNEMFIDDILE